MTAPVILVIDDDAAHLDRVTSHLRLLKMTVLQARTKEEALRAVERHDVGVVLLELSFGFEVDPEAGLIARLPALDLFEIARCRTRATPVIVVTYFDKPVYETIAIKLMAIRNGADVYLRKPLDLDLLSAYLRGKLNLRHSEPAAQGDGKSTLCFPRTRWILACTFLLLGVLMLFRFAARHPLVLDNQWLTPELMPEPCPETKP